MGIPHTRTQSIDVVEGSGVVPGMNAFVPTPNAWVRQMKNGWSNGIGVLRGEAGFQWSTRQVFPS